jgi:death-on-curing protein
VSERDYLTLADILAIHAVQIRRYGGSPGLRDAGALESALFRPQSAYYDDIIAEAAALLESLAINHPFIDGNKRVAFAATDVFLRVNGFRIDGQSLRIHSEIIAMLENGTFEFANLEPWLRRYVTKNV